MGYFTIKITNSEYKKTITNNALIRVNEQMRGISIFMNDKIEDVCFFIKQNKQLIEVLEESNLKTSKITNLATYIHENEWKDKTVKSPFIEDLISNNLSKYLREFINFYRQTYTFDLFPEIIISNKYGLNIAQTGPTSDYYQGDEKWFEEAISQKIYISDYEYDESSKTHSVSISLPINNDEGMIVGVAKIIMNIQGIINTVNYMKTEDVVNNSEIALVNKKGYVIYYTGELNLPKLNSVTAAQEFNKNVHIFNNNSVQSIAFISDPISYMGFKSDWKLIVFYDYNELFSPVTKPKLFIMLYFSLLIIISMFVFIILHKVIMLPVNKLIDTLKKHISINSNEEVIDFAKAFDSLDKKSENSKL